MTTPSASVSVELPRTLWGRIVALTRKIIGVPDYETYVRHMAACYPDRAPMTEAEFAEERLTAKYSRPGQRCC
ncbi:MAG: YbdD/YjiX family protein [Gemmatimonadetes bacterium]|nr:YbdD/YjiX family protein [Gemmatimonadota bacterium]